jgi:hypothetical protein
MRTHGRDPRKALLIESDVFVNLVLMKKPILRTARTADPVLKNDDSIVTEVALQGCVGHSCATPADSMRVHVIQDVLTT